LTEIPTGITAMTGIAFNVDDEQTARPAYRHGVLTTVLMDSDALPPYGGGKPSTRPVFAAEANAFFDVTGVRLRRASFTTERVKATLSS
jgi:hypothetical protein